MKTTDQAHGSAAITVRRLKELRDALIFIAGQGCGNTGDYEECKDLPDRLCVTEYCIPCYAAAALQSDDALIEWQERRKGLNDDQA